MNKNEQNRVVAWRLKLVRQASDVPRSVAQTCRHFGLSTVAGYCKSSACNARPTLKPGAAYIDSIAVSAASTTGPGAHRARLQGRRQALPRDGRRLAGRAAARPGPGASGAWAAFRDDPRHPGRQGAHHAGFRARAQSCGGQRRDCVVSW